MVISVIWHIVTISLKHFLLFFVSKRDVYPSRREHTQGRTSVRPQAALLTQRPALLRRHPCSPNINPRTCTFPMLLHHATVTDIASSIKAEPTARNKTNIFIICTETVLSIVYWKLNKVLIIWTLGIKYKTMQILQSLQLTHTFFFFFFFFFFLQFRISPNVGQYLTFSEKADNKRPVLVMTFTFYNNTGWLNMKKS